MDKVISKRKGFLLIMIAAVFLLSFGVMTQMSCAYTGEEQAQTQTQKYKITINKLKGNPYAGKYGKGFKEYNGTEFKTISSDVWYYDFGHGKLYIDADPEHYDGSPFHYWTTFNGYDSVWSTYAHPVNADTRENIVSHYDGIKVNGCDIGETYGNSCNIDFEGFVEATLGEAKVTLDKNTFTYTGKEIRPNVTKVTLYGVTLTPGVDYVVRYEENINAGDVLTRVIVTAEDFSERPFNDELDAYVIYEKVVPFTIARAAHPGIAVKAKTATIKYKKVKSKKQTVKMSKVVSVSGWEGVLSYTVKPVGTKAKKALKYKNGKITVRKGTKKGTYKVKVTVQDKDCRDYKNSAKKTVTAKIRVK